MFNSIYSWGLPILFMHVFWLLMSCLSLVFFVNIVPMLFLIMSSLCIRMIEIHTEIWKESSHRWIEGKGRELTIWILDLTIGTCLLMVGFFCFSTSTSFVIKFWKILCGAENWDLRYCIVLKISLYCKKVLFFFHFAVDIAIVMVHGP